MCYNLLCEILKKIMKKLSISKINAFTLIELLIVIAVMAILTSVVFVALNPLGRFQDARNNTRWTDVNTILQAIKIDQVDNGGTYLTEISDLTADLYYMIGEGSTCNLTCANPTVVLQSDCVDLVSLADEGYMPSVPYDPNATGADTDHSYYYMLRATNGTITVGSCSEEAGSGASTPQISVSR